MAKSLIIQPFLSTLLTLLLLIAIHSLQPTIIAMHPLFSFKTLATPCIWCRGIST